MASNLMTAKVTVSFARKRDLAIVSVPAVLRGETTPDHPSRIRVVIDLDPEGFLCTDEVYEVVDIEPLRRAGQ